MPSTAIAFLFRSRLEFRGQVFSADLNKLSLERFEFRLENLKL